MSSLNVQSAASGKLTIPKPALDAVIPRIFVDPRFHKSNGSSRRWQVAIGGFRVGIVVAWRPENYDNFALNKADLDKLLEFRSEDLFNAAFVVTATSTGSFDAGNFERVHVGHRDAEELAGVLKSARLRKGPHGDYFLLTEGVSPLEITSDDDIPWGRGMRAVASYKLFKTGAFLCTDPKDDDVNQQNNFSTDTAGIQASGGAENLFDIIQIVIE
jgi:hypothetical protein